MVDGLITKMNMLISIKLKFESLLYALPCDFCQQTDSKPIAHVLYLSNQRCYTLQVNIKESTLIANDMITLDKESLPFIEKATICACKFQVSTAVKEKPVNFFLGYSNGSFIRMDTSSPSKPLQLYNMNQSKVTSLCQVDITSFVMPEQYTDTFYVLARNTLLEYTAAEGCSDCESDYDVIKSIRNHEFFIEDKYLKGIEKKKLTAFGQQHFKERPGLSYVWADFAAKPYRAPISSAELESAGHKKLLLSAWRFNIGHITSMKIMAVRDNWIDSSKKGFPMFKSRKVQFGESDQKGKVTDLICIFTGNDGYLRVFSLLKNQYLLVSEYLYGGLNWVDINEEHTLMAIATQDDSVIILNLESSSALKVSIHSSFVTYCGFHTQLTSLISSKLLGDFNYTSRVFACSMDGTMSVIDLNRRLLLDNMPTVEYSEPLDYARIVIENGESRVESAGKAEIINLESLIVDEVTEECSRGNKLFVQRVKQQPVESKFGFAGGRVAGSLMAFYIIESSIFFYQIRISNRGSQSPVKTTRTIRPITKKSASSNEKPSN